MPIRNTQLASGCPPQDGAALLRQRMEAGQTILGCFLALGSALTAELMGSAGYDWALIDLEHGSGDERDALLQMQALAAAGCAAIVRVESTVRQRVNHVLDSGAHGVMFPRIDTAEQAREAVAAMRYAPEGVRGVAFANRACGYGSNFRPYLAGSKALITVVQIESPEAVRNASDIAACGGVDVLFIGPSDLSHSMGILGQFTHPDFVAAVEQVARAARENGKQCGILLPTPSEFERFHAAGYRFIASGNDAVLLNNAARALTEGLRTKLAGLE